LGLSAGLDWLLPLLLLLGLPELLGSVRVKDGTRLPGKPASAAELTGGG
jgi:hypothetical protein